MSDGESVYRQLRQGTIPLYPEVKVRPIGLPEIHAITWGFRAVQDSGLRNALLPNEWRAR